MARALEERDDSERSRNFPTKEERDEFLMDLRDGYDPDAGRELFGPFAVRWAEAQDWADTSRQSGGSLQATGPSHGPMPLEKIDNLALKGLQKRLADEDAGEGLRPQDGDPHDVPRQERMKSAYAIGAIKRDPTSG